MGKLTPKQKTFADEYLKDLNGKQAAIRAGYSEKTAEVQGSRLLTNAKVKEYIEKRQAKRSERTEITQDMVLQELAKIGFSNMLDYASIDENGDPFIDLSKLTKEQAAAISEITIDELRSGDDGKTTQRVKFKLHNKLAALQDLGKHLGMFVNRTEITGADGGDIKTVTKIERVIVDPTNPDT